MSTCYGHSKNRHQWIQMCRDRGQRAWPRVVNGRPLSLHGPCRMGCRFGCYFFLPRIAQPLGLNRAYDIFLNVLGQLLVIGPGPRWYVSVSPGQHRSAFNDVLVQRKRRLPSYMIAQRYSTVTLTFTTLPQTWRMRGGGRLLYPLIKPLSKHNFVSQKKYFTL